MDEGGLCLGQYSLEEHDREDLRCFGGIGGVFRAELASGVVVLATSHNSSGY